MMIDGREELAEEAYGHAIFAALVAQIVFEHLMSDPRNHGLLNQLDRALLALDELDEPLNLRRATQHARRRIEGMLKDRPELML